VVFSLQIFTTKIFVKKGMRKTERIVTGCWMPVVGIWRAVSIDARESAKWESNYRVVIVCSIYGQHCSHARHLIYCVRRELDWKKKPNEKKLPYGSESRNI
jgi:hypothetical protein